MAAQMKYPVGIQHFPDIITGGYAYIDKTNYIRSLENRGKYCFLSRPRRFGKSLFLTTLEAYFEGKRELFRGLAIDRDDVDWRPRPVIKLSLNTIECKSEESLATALRSKLRDYEEIYSIPDYGDGIPQRLERILKTAHEKTGRKAAVLIDEYDAPLLATLEDDALNHAFREILKPLFSVLKTADSHIHFAFITGVSRFSHTSLFSGANNLEDISLHDEYSAICGITEDEIRENLMTGIQDFAENTGISIEETLAKLKENYDGYHFSPASRDIYNPYSLLLALSARKISNYWFSSGTPSYLIAALKRDNFYLPQLDCLDAVESDLSAYESYLGNPVALLYESGYITIKDYDDDSGIYTLALPNHEVATSFSEALLPIYSCWDPESCRQSFVSMRKAVFGGDADGFMRHLQTFLEGNPYSNSELAKRETYFKTNIFLVLKALGFTPHAEEQTCRGRIDVMLRTRRFIFIFELKTDGDLRKALQQIDDRGYTLPYADEQRRIIRIAASYDSSRNNIGSWTVAE